MGLDLSTFFALYLSEDSRDIMLLFEVGYSVRAIFMRTPYNVSCDAVQLALVQCSVIAEILWLTSLLLSH